MNFSAMNRFKSIKARLTLFASATIFACAAAVAGGAYLNHRTQSASDEVSTRNTELLSANLRTVEQIGIAQSSLQSLMRLDDVDKIEQLVRCLHDGMARDQEAARISHCRERRNRV